MGGGKEFVQHALWSKLLVHARIVVLMGTRDCPVCWQWGIFRWRFKQGWRGTVQAFLSEGNFTLTPL